MRVIVCTALMMMAAVPAMAADPLPETVAVPEAIKTRDIVIDLGAGIGLEPTFPSAKTYGVTGWPLIALQYLRLPVLGEVVPEEKKLAGFSLFPAFNIEGERKESDASYLEGIDDRDWALELGGGAAFRYGFMRAFANVRYGFTGSNGFVGEAGVDVVTTPMERLQVSFGPRISAASANYMDYYFSVPNSAVQLSPYKADAGFKDVGVALTATYELTEKWRIHGRARYTHFIGEALDSPIVKAGNEQEFSVGIGLTYRFTLDLY